MENMNNKGKKQDNFENTERFALYSIIVMTILLIIVALLK